MNRPLGNVNSSSPNSEVEDVGEDGHADSGAGAGDHLDEFAAALEVLRQHHGRRLPHHRVAHAEEEAVAEMRCRRCRAKAPRFVGGAFNSNVYIASEHVFLPAAKRAGQGVIHFFFFFHQYPNVW